MNTTTQVQKPKIDNNALFAQKLLENPPEYSLGDLIRYRFKKETTSGVGYITGCIFNENEKNWKYTIKPYKLNANFDDVVILGKYTL